MGEDDGGSQEEEDAGDENSGLTSRFSSCGSLGEKDLGNFLIVLPGANRMTEREGEGGTKGERGKGERERRMEERGNK